jgi:hypothetical protein
VRKDGRREGRARKRAREKREPRAKEIRETEAAWEGMR